MSKFRNLVVGSALASALIASPAFAEKFGLGRPAAPEEIAAWDVDVRPDGLGLPPGSGSVEDGEMMFSEKCAACHGEFGEAVGRWPVLAGGFDTLDRADPVKTVGSYWPYLSTVWDYVHRSMPFGNAQSLETDEVYAIVAYILYVNDLVEDDFVLSNENFLEVEMPNAGGFIEDDRDTLELAEFVREPCMENCKETVEITMHATVLDVTPDDQTDDAAPAEEAAAEAPTEELVAEATVEETAEEVPADEVAVAEVDPALVEAGEKAFKKCAACHKVGEGAKNAVGPVLNGIVGRAAATVDGFRYSPALADAASGGLVWNAETLGAFLADPRGYVPKTKMTFAGLKKQDEIDAVIAYLSTFGG
ncbi:c-type cytochrome [Ostreiculturibacter nitratireducens]|uniref:c-type cytochrome n=1 Tax=Ostreiculturibacter nitratireducens TaxID=3075226 RepID=UPI0031B5CCEC